MLFDEIQEAKDRIKNIFPNKCVHLIVSDCQYFNLRSYQSSLNSFHSEIFDHPVPTNTKAMAVITKLSISLLNCIYHYNMDVKKGPMRPYKSMPDLKTNNWVMQLPINIRCLDVLPIIKGHLLNSNAMNIVAQNLCRFMQDTEQFILNRIQYLFVIGDPRLGALQSVWNEYSDSECVCIPDGSLTPESVVNHLKVEDKSVMSKSVVLICFSIKSSVIIQTVDTCTGHEPCKYVIYKHKSEQVVLEEMSVLVEKVCEDLLANKIICAPMFSPLIPVDFYKYRNTVGQRHLNNTGHDVTNDLPGSAASTLETNEMLSDINVMATKLKSLCKYFGINFIHLPKVALNDLMKVESLAPLQSGLSIDATMASNVADKLNDSLRYVRTIDGELFQSVIASGPGQMSGKPLQKPAPKSIQGPSSKLQSTSKPQLYDKKSHNKLKEPATAAPGQ